MVEPLSFLHPTSTGSNAPSDALRRTQEKSPSAYQTTSQIMPQSTGDVTAFSPVNPSAAADRGPLPMLSQRSFVLHSYFFKVLNIGEICEAGLFYGLPCPGLPGGTYRTAFNGGGKADIKYWPDGLSPVLLIKVPRTVHKSRPLSILLSVRIVIVIVHLQILT